LRVLLVCAMEAINVAIPVFSRFWLIVFCLSPDVAASRFTGLVDNFLEPLTSFLKRSAIPKTFTSVPMVAARASRQVGGGACRLPLAVLTLFLSDPE